MRIYEDIEPSNYLTSLQKALVRKRGTQRFPRDKEVISSLKERDIYAIHARNRNYFLERLENFENNEPVLIDNNPDITVEHIFPQNPDPKWKIILGEEQYDIIKEKYLNTIANITLSGNNGKLGNKYFTEKRDMNIEGKEQGYKFSRLWLNKYLASLEKWDLAELDKRFDLITNRFLKIWQYPTVEVLEEDESEEINIFDAEDPTNKKLDYAIFFDQKLEVRNISELFAEVNKTLFELNPQAYFASDLGEKLNLTKDKDKCRSALPLNETYFIEQHYSSRDKFTKMMQALTLMELPDELFIKYASDLES